jgi:hypothetical protein
MEGSCLSVFIGGYKYLFPRPHGRGSDRSISRKASKEMAQAILAPS